MDMVCAMKPHPQLHPTLTWSYNETQPGAAMKPNPELQASGSLHLNTWLRKSNALPKHVVQENTFYRKRTHSTT